MTFLDYGDITPREIAPGFSARFVHTNGMTVARVEVRAAARPPPPPQPPEHHTPVLAGELEHTVGGEVKILRAGMIAFIPGGVPHSARAVTACQVLDVFHPVRDDYR